MFIFIYLQKIYVYFTYNFGKFIYISHIFGRCASSILSFIDKYNRRLRCSVATSGRIRGRDANLYF